MDRKLLIVIAVFLPFVASCASQVGLVKESKASPEKTKCEVNLAKIDTAVVQSIHQENDGAFHIVGADETLHQICEVYGLNALKVAKVNGIPAPYQIKKGDTIFLPAEALLPDTTAVAEAKKSPKKSQCGIRKATRFTVANALLGKKDPSVPTLKFPVPRGVLTSPFGHRWGRLHKGLDIAAPIGTPVLACADGRVIFTGSKKKFRRYGSTVLIDHGKGIYTYYAHLSDILVKKNQQVSKGKKIALVGNTGRSTGPHLHLEVRVANNLYNPLAYFAPQEITGTLMTARFRESPMGPVRAKWRIPDLLTASN